jgi:hypothetical protein
MGGEGRTKCDDEDEDAEKRESRGGGNRPQAKPGEGPEEDPLSDTVWNPGKDAKEDSSENNDDQRGDLLRGRWNCSEESVGDRRSKCETEEETDGRERDPDSPLPNGTGK